MPDHGKHLSFGHHRIGHEISEPAPWYPCDHGARREPVYDENFSPPRLIRRVGYVLCISCRKHWFFSPDVTGRRMCDMCRFNKSDSSFDELRVGTARGQAQSPT